MRTRRSHFTALLLSAVVGIAAPAHGEPVSVSGSVAFETRLFVQSPQFAGQIETVQPAWVGEPELFWRSDDRKNEIRLSAFVRIDGADDNRSLLDMREAFWRRVEGDIELLVGVNTVFWGVTESRHLVNIVNQVDTAGDLTEEEFLGQPMVNIGLQKSWGRLDAFVLPAFRERRFPGRKGRLRGAAPINDLDMRGQQRTSFSNPDFALRYSHYLGPLDIGVHYFRGTAREPRLADADIGAPVAIYDRINQGGLDMQLTLGAWLFKFEGIARRAANDDFVATVAGLEYTMHRLGGGSADLGLLLEYLYDGRDPGLGSVAAFENDLFSGVRFALNDAQDTSILAGAVTDIENGSTSIRLEAERRLGAVWTIELEGQWFANIRETDPFAAFHRDDHIALRIARHF